MRPFSLGCLAAPGTNGCKSKLGDPFQMIGFRLSSFKALRREHSCRRYSFCTAVWYTPGRIPSRTASQPQLSMKPRSRGQDMEVVPRCGSCHANPTLTLAVCTEFYLSRGFRFHLMGDRALVFEDFPSFCPVERPPKRIEHLLPRTSCPLSSQLL